MWNAIQSEISHLQFSQLTTWAWYLNLPLICSYLVKCRFICGILWSSVLSCRQLIFLFWTTYDHRAFDHICNIHIILNWIAAGIQYCKWLCILSHLSNLKVLEVSACNNLCGCCFYHSRTLCLPGFDIWAIIKPSQEVYFWTKKTKLVIVINVTIL